MSKRSASRVKRALKERRAEYDAMKIEDRKAYIRPGSLNPRKTHGGRRGRRR